jgi:hypothetical protein
MNLKLEQQTMSPEEGAASADSNQDVNPDGASTDLQAENTRLRQENARNKQIQQRALPYVQGFIELEKATGGKDIIAKLEKAREKGVPANLTQEEQAKVEDAAAAAGVAPGITAEQLTAALDQHEQKTFDRENARDAVRRLQERGIKELPGYESLYRTPEWARKKSVVLALAQNDPSIIPDDETDAYWWVEKETYEQLASKNPDIGKVKRVGKKESDRRGAIAGVSQQSAAAPEETEDNLPAYVKKLRDGTNRPGKSLATHYRKKR